MSEQRRRWWPLALTGLVLLGAVLLWQFTPLAELAAPQRLASWIDSFQEASWSPVAMIVIFIVGGLIVFPITVLITATALVFDPLDAILISYTGTLGNATLLYLLGSGLARYSLQARDNRVVRRLNAALEDRGIVAVAIVRTIPLAPFSFVNLAAGVIGIPLRDYLIGTALGITPGIAVITAFGEQLRQVLEEPTAIRIVLLIGVLLAWIALSLLLQRAATRWRQRRQRQQRE